MGPCSQWDANGGRDPYDDAEEFAAVNAEAEAADAQERADAQAEAATYAKLETPQELAERDAHTITLEDRLRASLKRQGLTPYNEQSVDIEF